MADLNYNEYSVEDFIKDESFQRWVYFPDTENSAYWDGFLKQNPSKREDVEEARRFLQLLNFSEGDIFQSKIHALKKRIDFAIDHPELAATASEKIQARKNFMSTHWLKIAASVAVLVIAGYFVGRRMLDFAPPQTAETNEQSTGNGERTIISLEDGTKVWLNSASRIRYPERFSDMKIREVYLDGEAFFDVAEDKNHPFIVHTQAVRIKVLGTSFNVRSYEKDDEIQTTLVRGKVTVESLDEQPKIVTLAPNQVATYHKESRKIVLDSQTDVGDIAGWKDGRLIFDNKPLSEIVLALERWYNVTITVEDESSLKCHFSAKIENLSLEEVLELFKASDGIEYSINGQDVVIRGAICEN